MISPLTWVISGVISPLIWVISPLIWVISIVTLLVIPVCNYP